MENVQRIPYRFEDRAAVIAQIEAARKIIVHSALYDLDENGRHTNCFFEVVDAPPEPEPNYPALLAQADTDILNLTEQLILAQEGLA